MGGFISCLGLLIAYMIYRLVALYQTLTGDASSDPYFFSRKTMTVFGELCTERDLGGFFLLFF